MVERKKRNNEEDIAKNLQTGAKARKTMGDIVASGSTSKSS